MTSHRFCCKTQASLFNLRIGDGIFKKDIYYFVSGPVSSGGKVLYIPQSALFYADGNHFVTLTVFFGYSYFSVFHFKRSFLLLCLIV